MAGIGGIQNIGAIQWPQAIQGPARGGQNQAGRFGQMLEQAVNGADADQQQAVSAVQDLLTGKTDNSLPVVNAAAKADMSFKLLMGVRNKMIEAYKQTINMQV